MVSIDALRAALGERLTAIPKLEVANEPFDSAHGGTRLARVELPVQPLSPLAWLDAQSTAVKMYWRDRTGEFEYAGVGRAHSLTGDRGIDERRILRAIGASLRASTPGVRYFGGMAFAAQQRPPEPDWAAFCGCHFVVPRFELLRDGKRDRFLFACTIALDDNRAPHASIAEALDEFSTLRFAEPPQSRERLPKPLSRQDFPNRAAWTNNVGAALRLLEQKTLDKIVLARQSLLNFPEPLRPLALLAEIGLVTTDCYLFCFQPAAGCAFIGATPELLYRRDDSRISADAIAGTRDRGASKAADEALGQELLRSPKDRLEHRIVGDSLRAALRGLGCTITSDEPVGLRKLRRVQHLYQAIGADAPRDCDDADLLSALQPTAAVGGYPTPVALRFIDRLETFHRGWYAGPLGWIDATSAEFAVGIRSGLVHGDRLRVFAGAGIVAGSDASSEWDEVEKKLNAMIDLVATSSHGS